MEPNVKEPTFNEGHFNTLNRAISKYLSVRSTNEKRPYRDVDSRQGYRAVVYLRNAADRMALPFSAEDLRQYAQAVQTLDIMNGAALEYEIKMFDAAVVATLAFFQDYFPDYNPHGQITVLSGDFDYKPINVIGLRLGSLRYFPASDRITGVLQFGSMNNPSNTNWIAQLTISADGVWAITGLTKMQEDDLRSTQLPLCHPEAQQAFRYKQANSWAELREEIAKLSGDGQQFISVDRRDEMPPSLLKDTCDGAATNYRDNPDFRQGMADQAQRMLDNGLFNRMGVVPYDSIPDDYKLPNSFDPNSALFVSAEEKTMFLRRHPLATAWDWYKGEAILTNEQMAMLKSERPAYTIHLSKGVNGGDLDQLCQLFESPTLANQLFRSYLIYATGQDLIFEHPSIFQIEEEDTFIRVTQGDTEGQTTSCVPKLQSAVTTPYAKVLADRLADWEKAKRCAHERREELKRQVTDVSGYNALAKMYPPIESLTGGETVQLTGAMLAQKHRPQDQAPILEKKPLETSENFTKTMRDVKQAPAGLSFNKTERPDGK
jgi:hypothetical protein